MSAAVVRLPTAAPRQVKQRWNKGTRALREQLPQFPRDHCHTPGERKALERATLIKQVEPCVALAIATAMFRQLDELAQLQVIASCGMSAATSGKLEPLLAVEWLDAQRKGRNHGDNAYLEWALKQLEQEEAK